MTPWPAQLYVNLIDPSANLPSAHRHRAVKHASLRLAIASGFNNVLAIGASRNIGYYSAVRLLRLGSSVTFLLRNPSVFDGNEELAPFISSGKAILVKGDAMKQAEIKSAWDAASEHGSIDVILFTVGGIPSFSLKRGVFMTPENLVTQCLLNLLCTIPTDLSTPPKLVAITSMGVTHDSHKRVPVLLKPLYAYGLAAPHKDKVGAERVISYFTGWPWNAKADGEPGDNIMGANEPAYRISEGDISGWTVSRKDVAHFIVDAVTKRWNEFGDKTMTIAY
ncbi:hypothetical protein BDZ89DRAFT_1237076 [Hymenopellis radicata]|nr:hypothetical protein BDZ89DRAFT_1237076 [Hymenopellis radicata]